MSETEPSDGVISTVVDSVGSIDHAELEAALRENLETTPREQWCQSQSRLRTPWMGGLLAALIPVLVALFFLTLNSLDAAPSPSPGSRAAADTAAARPATADTSVAADPLAVDPPDTDSPRLRILGLVLLGGTFVAVVAALGIRQTADAADRKDIARKTQLFTTALGVQNEALRKLVAAESKVTRQMGQAVTVVLDSVGEIGGSVTTVQQVVGEIDGKVQKMGEGEEVLHRIVKTLAPSWAFQTFDAIFEPAEGVALPVLADPDASRDEIVHAIRAVLFGYLIAVQRFEAANWTFGPAPNIRYAVNVMVCIPAAEVVGERETLQSTLRFWDNPAEDLDSVLDLRPELSAAITAAGPASPDPALTPLALPVPVRPSVRVGGVLRYRVLPGAPFAFVYQDKARELGLYRYPDSATLAQWCRDKGDFTQEICQQVEDFFDPHAEQNVRSLVAYPLSRTPIAASDAADATVPLGVLNLHSNHPGLLGSDRSESFETVTYPLKLLMLRLLERLRAHDHLGRPGQWILTPHDAQVPSDTPDTPPEMSAT